MTSNVDTPKREPTPAAPLSLIPQKRPLDDRHSPAVSSPLNPDVKVIEPQPPPALDETLAANRSKPSRVKKDTLKKRESRGGESILNTPDVKSSDIAKPAANSGPLRYKLAPPKPSDFDLARGPVMTLHHQTTTSDGQTLSFLETSEHVFNKKNFRYTHCIADPSFPSMLYYRQTEPEPFGPRMSFEDTAMHVFFDKSALQVTTGKGFRMARANVAVREGRWYWECKITQGIQEAKDESGKPQGGRHVRLGWARREASLDAPVGFDAYSYGIRDVAGEKVHMSRPKTFFPPNESIREGDVIGLEIQLPSQNLHRKVVSGNYNPTIDADDAEPVIEASNIVRDRVPIRFKSHTYFEKIEYHSIKDLEDLMNPSPTGAAALCASQTPNPNHSSPALRTLPNSCVRIYKNGVLMGEAFENLLAFLPPASKPMAQVGAREGFDDGMLGYYPAISVFRGGAAQVNFGPEFWYPPPDYSRCGNKGETAAQKLGRLRAISERFHEQIAEDIVYDVIDEVDFWMQDGGGSAGANSGQQNRSNAATNVPGREEIKELVQDD